MKTAPVQANPRQPAGGGAPGFSLVETVAVLALLGLLLGLDVPSSALQFQAAAPKVYRDKPAPNLPRSRPREQRRFKFYRSSRRMIDPPSRITGYSAQSGRNTPLPVTPKVVSTGGETNLLEPSSL